MEDSLNKTAGQFVKTLLTLLVLIGFTSVTMTASINSDGSKKINKNLPLSYFNNAIASGPTTAKVTGVDKVTNITFYNPCESKTGTYSVGTFKGDVDGQSASFYCIDLGHPLAEYTTSQPHTYTDKGATATEITYILNNYYPYKSIPYTGSLGTETKEAAAVQLAIWYFSDALDISTVTDATIKARALAIKADAISNAASYIPLETLLIVPSNQNIPTGTTAKFTVSTFDLNGSSLSGITVNLTATTGTLSSASAITGTSGTTSELTLAQGSSTTSTITATAAVTIPQGTQYVHKISPDTYQKLVLATPAGLTREVTSTVKWYTPGTCDTKGYTTYTQGGWGSSSNSAPGKIRDLYFSTVFPSGLTVGSTYTIKLTSATAVKNFLPQGGTAAVLTQNYTNVSTKFNILAGQVVALTLSVAYDKAGKIGTNSTDLGDLYILSGTFAGMSVNNFLTIANKALGGETTGYTISDINTAATAINENFDNGTADNGYLTCQSQLKSSLGDKVWIDANKNGIQDSGEAGLAGVTVSLYDCSSNLISTTTTDSNGNYLFSNLSAGSYTVVFAKPTGYVFTIKDTNSNGSDAADSDADLTTGKTTCITLLAGVTDLTWDAGLYKECKNTIGDFVWHDTNVNGVQDSGEAGIAGVIVELLQTSTVIATTTTDANGKYEFSNLNDGTYGVRVAASNYTTGGALYSTTQVKWYSTTKDTGSDDAVDSDAAKNEAVSVTLNCGDNKNVDFGFYKTCVGITKYTDATSYNAGATITYKFTVENCGDVTLHGGIDIFDAMLNKSGTHLIKHIDILEAGKSTTFTMDYVSTEEDCGTLVNTVTAEGHPVDGSAYVYDESNWTVTVVCDLKADLKIEKSVDNTAPKNDDVITYTVKVTNLGPNAAKNAEATDLLPSGLVYQSASPSQGTYSNTTGIWSIGNMANGAVATLTISVKVNVAGVNSSTFDLGVAKEFGLFVLQDLTQPSSDTEGKVAVGRDAVLGGYSVADKLSSNSGDVLVVGRDLTYTSGAIYNGNVVYGHATNLPINAVSITGGTLRKDTPIDFTAATTYFENLSTQLGAYSVNGTTTSQWGGITLTGSDPYLNVFKVSGSDMSSSSSLEINVPNGSVVLVNVSGTTVKWTGGLTVNGTSITNVLYNFYEAANLTIQGIDVRGSVLAPFASLTYPSGVINGQVIVKSMTGSGQFNNSIFQGHIPYERKITNVALVSGCSTTDPVSTNNTSSVLVTVTNLTTSGSGTTGTTTTTTWSNVTSFTQGEIVYSMIYDASGNIFAGTWGGKIYESTNNGTNWTLINSGMNASYIWGLNISSSTLFAATDKGIYKFTGSAWVAAGLTGKDVHAIVSYNGTLYAGTWGYGVFVSTDNGTTWTELNSGLGAYLAIQSLTVSSNGTVLVGTAGYGVLKLVSGAWTKVTTGYDVVWALTSAANYVYAGTYGNGLMKSADNGSTWTKVTSLNVAYVYALTSDASGKVYASSYTNGIMASTDNGSTWSSLGMSGYGVSTVVVSSSNVYAGTRDGVIYKITNNAQVTATEGTTEVPTTYQLAQNYPNPFNPTTTIQFSVPQTSRVMIRVFNSIGQEVAVLADQEFSSGVHKVSFDASRLSSGMYIYQMIGKNLNITKKMMLLK
jgi:choice-of-anchor A domain-containing protein/uncharacterized repeat protein (TIGR01451 family)/TQXA domain-containing protein